MRIKNMDLLKFYYCRFLTSQFPLPEPPSDEEMEQELKGLERLEEALRESSND